MKILFAITGTAFFSVFLVSIIIFGDESSRNTAIFASFLAGLSQFIAQDDRHIASIGSIVLAYASMIMGVIAFAMMAS